MTPPGAGRPTAAGPPLSRALHARMVLVRPALDTASRALWAPQGLRERYPAYLTVMHQLVRASVPLLRHGARRCAEGDPDDPVLAPLAGYLLAHAQEELGHDAWLLEDLAALGEDPARAAAAQPLPAVAELAGAQYYWIEHHHPVALLGYVWALEHNAPAGWLAPRLAATAGLPPAALRTVHAHAALDAGHTADLEAVLDALPLTAAQATAVTVGALHTLSALVRLFAHLADPSARPPTAAPHPAHEEAPHDRSR